MNMGVIIQAPAMSMQNRGDTRRYEAKNKQLKKAYICHAQYTIQIENGRTLNIVVYPF